MSERQGVQGARAGKTKGSTPHEAGSDGARKHGATATHNSTTRGEANQQDNEAAKPAQSPTKKELQLRGAPAGGSQKGRKNAARSDPRPSRQADSTAEAASRRGEAETADAKPGRPNGKANGTPPPPPPNPLPPTGNEKCTKGAARKGRPQAKPKGPRRVAMVAQGEPAQGGEWCAIPIGPMLGEEQHPQALARSG